MREEPVHGWYATYNNHKCRCAACRAAWTAYCQRRRDERAARTLPEGVPHGNTSTYFNYKCRCRACKDARAQYEHERLATVVELA